MNTFTIEFFDRNFSPVPAPNGVVLTPRSWGGEEIGGPKQAEISGTGNEASCWRFAEWLRYGFQIRNNNGTICWWGELHGVEITVGALTVGLSLDEMSNRIMVRFSYDAPGGTVSGTTNWSQDDFSVATYGAKELVVSASKTPLASATARLASELAKRAWPVGTPNLGDPAQDDRAASVVLHGKGWPWTLDWKYYAQPTGRIVYDVGGTDQVLGWGFSAPLGFTHADNRIHNIDAKWVGLPTGGKVQISGLGANNGAFTVTQATSEAIDTYTANSIFFETNDDIKDNAGRLAFVRNHEMIQVSGSAANNGYHRIDGTGDDHITVDETWNTTISNDSAGASVTIKQGSSIEVAEAVSNALPGSTATVVAHGMKVAQAFTLPTTGSWTPGEILVKLKKSGAPGDGVKVSIQTDSGSAPSATILDSVTVAASNIGSTADWISFMLAMTATLNYGTTYWLVIERTGVNSNTDYYVVDVDDQAGYAGALRLWTGASWVARATDADLAFQIWGYKETTAQMQDVASACGQFGLSLVVSTASGLYERQYRDGGYTGWSEILDLVGRGTASGQRLLVAPWPGRRELQVYAEPTANAGSDLLWRRDGRLYYPGGAPYESGQLPVGQWITLADVPASINSTARLSPIFASACEYDPAAGRWRITPRGASDVWDLGSRQG